jgi:hypothetical protein
MGRAAPDIPDGMRAVHGRFAGGRPIRGDCRFRNPCGRRPRKWQESTAFSERPRF